MKTEDIHLKYLAINQNDLLWGLAVNSVGTQAIAPGAHYPPTGHPARYLFTEQKGRVLHEYQLLYITEGQGWFNSASLPRRVRLSRGSIFLLFPGEWHTYAPDPETGWQEYWIGFNGAVIDSWTEKGFFTRENPVVQIGLRNDIVHLYNEAIQVAGDQKSGFQQRLLGVVTHLLGLAVFYGREEAFSEVNEQINRAKIIIDSDFRTIRPEELADRLCMGYSNFRKVFKEYTGFSPARYILEVRMTHVKEVLTNSMQPIKQIAYDMGFDNYDYFFTAFRRMTGMTPGAYRDMTQGKKL